MIKVLLISDTARPLLNTLSDSGNRRISKICTITASPNVRVIQDKRSNVRNRTLVRNTCCCFCRILTRTVQWGQSSLLYVIIDRLSHRVHTESDFCLCTGNFTTDNCVLSLFFAAPLSLSLSPLSFYIHIYIVIFSFVDLWRPRFLLISTLRNVDTIATKSN